MSAEVLAEKDIQEVRVRYEAVIASGSLMYAEVSEPQVDILASYFQERTGMEPSLEGSVMNWSLEEDEVGFSMDRIGRSVICSSRTAADLAEARIIRLIPVAAQEAH